MEPLRVRQVCQKKGRPFKNLPDKEIRLKNYPVDQLVPPTDGDPRNAVYAGDARAFEKPLEAASKMSFGLPPYSA